MGGIEKAASIGAAGLIAVSLATPASAAASQYFVVKADEFQVIFWNTASIRRGPDAITFDALSYEVPFSRTGANDLKEHAFSVRVSCGLRAIWRTGDTGPARVGMPTGSPRFMTSSDAFQKITNHLCAGGVTNNDGLGRDALRATAEQIVSRWNPPRPPLPPLPYPPSSPPPPPLPVPPIPALPKWEDVPAWVDQIHRFTSIRNDQADARAYVDRTSVLREGDIATGLGLTLLGAETPRGGPSEMRLTRYDCGQKTLSVQARIIWDATGRLQVLTNAPEPPRAQGESPVTAAEISTACGAPRPAPPRHWTSSCAWDALSPSQRAGWIGNRNRFAPVLYGEMRQLLTTCHVPLEDEGELVQALRQRAIQYGGLQHLLFRREASFETRMLSAMKAIAPEDRQRLASDAPADRIVLDRVTADLARALDISAPREIAFLRDIAVSRSVVEYQLGLRD